MATKPNLSIPVGLLLDYGDLSELAESARKERTSLIDHINVAEFPWVVFRALSYHTLCSSRRCSISIFLFLRGKKRNSFFSFFPFQKKPLGTLEKGSLLLGSQTRD
jgi:hypothetical protein